MNGTPHERGADEPLPESSTPGVLRPAELARLARAGSRSAFDGLVDRYQGPLFRFLLARVGNRAEAEDLCQDAFLRAWEKIDRYDDRWSFSTWLYTIAQRIAVSRARKLRPDVDADVVQREAGGRDPAIDHEQTEERAGLWALAERYCTPDQRSALWLRYGEDLSYEELGRILDRPVTTVRVQLFRARRVLEQKWLEREAARERPRSRAGAPLFGAPRLAAVPTPHSGGN